MALKNLALNISGGPSIASASFDDQTALAADVTTAIGDAETANAVAGAKADVTTELAAITTALGLMTANQPSGAIIITLDDSLVTTKSQLRSLLDAAYRHFADSQSFLT